MTYRAVGFGLLLGLAISTLSYFNDTVIGQTFLVGGLLPIFLVAAMIMALLLNPLLGKRALRPGEFAFAAAIGMAACGWPGGSYMRTFLCNLAMPTAMYPTNAAWRDAAVLSYVPGGSPLLTDAFIQDPNNLAVAMTRQQDADPLRRAIDAQWSAESRAALTQLAATEHMEKNQRLQFIQLLNRLIEQTNPQTLLGVEADSPQITKLQQMFHDQDQAIPPSADHETQLLQLHQKQMRLLLHWAYPQWIQPAPEGQGVLVNGGQPSPTAIDPLQLGQPQMTLSDIPWRAWWPSIRLWGGLALLLGSASLCLALIVHPQWSQRELLAYPIANFMRELFTPMSPNGLSTILRNRMFWYGIGGALTLHLLNGLHVWFPGMPLHIPLDYDFTALKVLTPQLSKVNGAWSVFAPHIILSLVGFAYFLRADVSLSIGLSGIIWLCFGGIFMGYGIDMGGSSVASVKPMNMLLFGAYLGGTLLILFNGRRYYIQLTSQALGIKRQKSAVETPAYAKWAMRGLIVCLTLAVWLLTTAGLAWPMGLALVGLIMMTFLMVTRISAETGALVIQPFWMPMSVLVATLGFEAVGPVAFVVTAVACIMLVGDTREIIMAFLTNGLWLATQTKSDAHAKPVARPGRVAFTMAAMIVLGLATAMVSTFYLSYHHGTAGLWSWLREGLPSIPFDQLSANISELSARGELAQSTTATTWQRLSMIQSNGSALIWMATGAGLLASCWIARLRFSWWPLHPVLFLVWGTYAAFMMAWSFLFGWGLKALVVKIGGQHAYQFVKPLIVGLIAGEVVAAFAWISVGAIYFLTTGMAPLSYNVFGI